MRDRGVVTSASTSDRRRYRVQLRRDEKVVAPRHRGPATTFGPPGGCTGAGIGPVPRGEEARRMTSSEQRTSTALVTGASRGFGRGIASALHATGIPVVAVARNAEPLASLRDELGDTITTVVAD